MFTLSDLLKEYPPLTINRFQQVISSKKEFNELASPLFEATPQPGQLYNHQKLFLRYMRAYNEILVTDATGTGKAISIASITEYLKHQHFLMADQPYDILNGHFKQAIILLQGEALRKEFLKQLINKASDDYTEEKVKEMYPDSTMDIKKLIKKQVGLWYKFYTYQEFAKMVKKLEVDELKRNYNHSIIVIDEAHNLLVEDTTDIKLKPDKAWTKEDTYQNLMRFFLNVEHSKKIIVTATPMLNEVREFATLFNLLLPENEQFKSQDEAFYESITVEKLNETIRGRVTYIKSLVSDAKREDQGEGGIYKTTMSRFQSKIYREMFETYGGQQYGKFLAYTANFVFPDGSITEGKDEEEEDKTGYYKYVVKEKVGKDRRKQFVYKLKNMTLDSDDVKKYSCKYYSILKSLEKDPGPAFIYGKYNVGSGNIMLGLCLEYAFNYERFMETKSVFEGNKIKISKEKRYALLTGETIQNDAAFESIMELMNSYDNRHGEYLKCVIASRVARDGLNFRNILSIHLIEPDRNPSTMYQAISRGIRAGSHDDLLVDGQVVIKVYKHAAIPIKKIFDDEEWIIDLRNYAAAEVKSKKIEIMLNKIRQCTIGCQINQLRNNTDCVDPHNQFIDYSTYNAYYLEEDAYLLINILLPIITKLQTFTIKDLSGYEPDLLLITLNLIILKKIPILNQFGFTNYLYEKDGRYFISYDYSQGHLGDDYYTQNLIVTTNQAGSFTQTLDERHYLEFIQLNDHIKEQFELLSIDNKIKVLEEQYFTKNPKYDFLIRPFLNLFYKVDEVKISDYISKKGLSEVKTGNKLHINLLNILRMRNKHTLVQDYLKAKTELRVYREKWEEMGEENELYSQKISQININLFNNMRERYDYLFGIQIGGDILIVNGNADQGSDEKVGREQGRGKACTSFQKADVVDIATRLKISKKEIQNNDKIKPLCQLIKDKIFRDNRLFKIKNDY